ncbi:MAG TPA: hypothetical protein VM580_09860, partial [Labilithrix sp.]|nr:hypothetical protein [Labilithrix sp.]
MAAKAGKNTVTVEYDDAMLYPTTTTTHVSAWTGGVPTGTTTLRASKAYDARHGKPTVTIDASGSTQTAAFDSLGRLLWIRGHDLSPIELHTYDDGAAPSITSTIYSQGPSSTPVGGGAGTPAGKAFRRYTRLDGEGRVLGVVEGNGDSETPFVRRRASTYDAFGNERLSRLPALSSSLTDIVVPSDSRVVARTHSALGWLLVESRPDGSAIHVAYGPRFEERTEPRGNRTRHIFDARGQLRRVERMDAVGAIVSAHELVRDGLGRIARVVDGDGSIRDIQRDGGGRVSSFELPHMPGAPPAVFKLCHDQDDKPVAVWSPNRQIDVTYDELGRAVRLHATSSAGSEVNVTHDYDGPVPYGKGRLTSSADVSGRVDLAYDAFGHQSHITYFPSALVRSMAPLDVEAQYDVALEYGLRGDLLEARVSSELLSTNLGYTRDGFGRVRGVTAWEGAARRTLVGATSFDAEDRLVSASFGNGDWGTWQFDPASGLLARITYEDGTHAEAASVAYTYDRNGNPLTEVRSANHALLTEKVHTFDSLDRLSTTRVRDTGGRFDTVENFVFSPGGNLVSATGQTYAYGLTHAQAVMQIDAPGRTTPVRSLTYDPEGSVSSDTLYDAAGGIEESRTFE